MNSKNRWDEIEAIGTLYAYRKRTLYQTDYLELQKHVRKLDLTAAGLSKVEKRVLEILGINICDHLEAVEAPPPCSIAKQLLTH